MCVLKSMYCKLKSCVKEADALTEYFSYSIDIVYPLFEGIIIIIILKVNCKGDV